MTSPEAAAAADMETGAGAAEAPTTPVLSQPGEPTGGSLSAAAAAPTSPIAELRSFLMMQTASMQMMMEAIQ